jgi:hypothetical protein
MRIRITSKNFVTFLHIALIAMAAVHIGRSSTIIYLNSINHLVVVIETQWVICEVGIEFFMKITVFWDIIPCSPLKVNRRFGGTDRFHLEGCRISRTRNQRESRWQALKMEAICSSETSVDFQRNTRRYITEESTIHNHCCENLKSYMEFFMFYVDELEAAKCWGTKAISEERSDKSQSVYLVCGVKFGSGPCRIWRVLTIRPKHSIWNVGTVCVSWIGGPCRSHLTAYCNSGKAVRETYSRWMVFEHTTPPHAANKNKLQTKPK